MKFSEEINLLAPLVISLKGTRDLGEKQECLLEFSRVKKALSEELLKPFLHLDSDLSSKIALFALVAIDQHRRVLAYDGRPPREKIRILLHTLTSIEHFYESIGGIVGYQLVVLEKISEKKESEGVPSFSSPSGVTLGREATLSGIEALPEVGEIYPIGGLGSRLDLKNKMGARLPAARLPFCGRTLLEGLIRDVQAREFCYYKLFGKQVTVPVAIMTSMENRNCSRVKAICEKRGWFGRPKENFSIFSQLSVPVVTVDGEWAMEGPLQLHLQPGGHGALWRTAQEEGIFNWFQEMEKHRLLIRQINNPIAGTDQTLFALAGTGKRENKAFGFASCPRHPQAAEGVLVLKEENGVKSLSNIEYTDFKRYGLEGSSYPANTNILYADLKKLLPLIKRNPLPGLVFNLKDQSHGRLESMMQSLSDRIDDLSTFLTYNERRRTISATKRSFHPEKSLLETPEGAFYDLLFNHHELLEQYCGFSLPSFSTPTSYLQEGPSLLFLYHPALGPLYEVIRQKLRGGRIGEGSELQLEVADLLIEDLDLEGSLSIEAENLLGHRSRGIVRYSQRTGKCVLKNVKIRNRGIHPLQKQPYWKNAIKRYEEVRVVLKGHSELYAEDVTLLGNQTIVVPDGERWVLLGDGSVVKEKPDWSWGYKLEDDKLIVECDHRLTSQTA